MEKKRNSETLFFNTDGMNIQFKGIPLKENIDTNQIQEQINQFIKSDNYKNIVNIVCFLRTILRDYQEIKLFIFYKNEFGTELVEYSNLELMLFKKSENKQVGDYQESYRVQYHSSLGIDLNYNNTDSINSNDMRVASDKIYHLMNQINELKNAHSIELDPDVEKLIEIYTLFFNESPDFNNPNIEAKFQLMISILIQFGSQLDNFSSDLNILYSKDIKTIIENLKLLNGIYPKNHKSKLNNYQKKVIRILRETIEIDSNQDEYLHRISKMIHIARYKHFSSSKGNFLNYHPQENDVELVTINQQAKK